MMERYVATFHTHLAALRSCRALERAGLEVRMAPVPRQLSPSCGACALYQGEGPALECLDRDLEAVYRREGEAYVLLHSGEA